MRPLTGILVLMLLATPALALPSTEDMFESKLSALGDAVDVVAEGLAGQATLDKSQKKVLKALQKALKIGDQIETIEIDKKVLKKLGKVMKAIEKALKASETDLASIRSALGELKTAIESVVDEAKSEAEDEQAKLGDQKNIQKIEKKIDGAVAKLVGIDSLWAERFAKAWAVYVKAFLGYEKAFAAAEKYYEKELKSSGVLAGFKFDSDGKLINTSGGNVDLLDLIYDMKISVPGAPAQSFKFKLSDEAPNGTLPVAMGTGTFDPGTYNFGAIAQVWNLVGGFGIKITGKIVYVTSAGNMTYKFN